MVGASVSIDSGAGLSTVANWSMSDTTYDRVTTAAPAVSRKADVSWTHAGIGFGYGTGPVTLGIKFGSKVTDASLSAIEAEGTVTSGSGEIKATGVCFAAVYDLGGGAALQLGLGTSETETAAAAAQFPDSYEQNTNDHSWSLGLAFSF